MPIKFRCEYCRQLMGIAHSKAGSLVDCPTCGRTLRVPNEDGTVDPPPAFGLNQVDDELRRALDELSQLGSADVPSARGSEQPPIQDVDPLRPNRSSTRQGSADTPPAIVKPKPFVSGQPTAISPFQPVVREASPLQAAVDRPVSPGLDFAATGSIGPATALAGVSPEQIVAGIAGRSIPAGLNSEKSRAAPRDSGYSLKWLLLATVASGFVGGGLGFGLGRASAPYASAAIRVQPAAIPAIAPDEAAGKPFVKGRLTFQNARGQLEPDAGACVVLLPAPRADTAKLRTDGLHPNDEPAAREPAVRALQEQGGRLAIADREGNFRVELPAAGTYRLLALSHFQGRSADSDGPANARQIIQENFERPDQLVGQLAFEVTEITHSGTGTMLWDHTFPKP